MIKNNNDVECILIEDKIKKEVENKCLQEKRKST